MDIENMIAKLPLKEKVALCSGKDEWRTKTFPKYGLQSVMMSDGPHGLRKQLGAGDILGIVQSEEATCFPVESLLACSFDPELAGLVGAAIAEEAGAAGVALFLGPGVNIQRNPLCGRNFEYLSEDPYLAGKLAAAYISAAQRKGIGTSLKHYACNSQEYYRMVSDSIIDERTLREIYLTAFEYAVKEAHPRSIMCAYNQVNGTFCSDNQRLLTGILREEWGFDGFVVTDWGAIHDRSLAFQAGCDLVMPGGNAYGEMDVCRNIQNGKLSQKYIDQSVRRILNFVDRSLAALQEHTFTFNRDVHHELARQAAEGCAVLLKNEDHLLPCQPEEIVLIGQLAENIHYQGSGSSRINPTQVDQVIQQLPDAPYAPGYDADGNTTDQLVENAVNLARGAKKVIILVGLPEINEAEGLDREHMQLPAGQNRLIQEIAKINPNAAVVLCCGSPVETPWADEVKAFLYMGLSGQAGASALVNLLTGKVNPSGRLAATWPVTYSDCPSASFYANGMRNAEYREGIYVGYRYYEKAGVPVRFPFGAGLSYTTFAYHGLKLDGRRVSVTVTNTGNRWGGDAVLCFVHAPQNGIHRPVRELKGVKKIFLAPGESQEVTFELDDRSFAVWKDGWKVYAGEYQIQVGDCLIPLQVQGETWDASTEQPAWYRSPQGIIDRDEWIKSLGWTPAETMIYPYTINSTVEEISHDSLLIRILYSQFEKTQAKVNGRGSLKYRTTMKSADESPLRNVQNSTMRKGHFAQAIADFGNRKFLLGLWHLIQ